jgi:hypothetical protein
MKTTITIKNILAYLTGNIRYFLYYSKASFFIRWYIKDQIDWRVLKMNKECYNNGSCEHCGCKTIALQMANKSCGGNCYPPMMNKKGWMLFKKGRSTL